MEEKDLKQRCLKLMQTANAVYLGTIGRDGFPYIRMMTNLRNKEENPKAAEAIAQKKEDFTIYFVTSKSSPKMQQIRANPRVSAYLCNPAELLTLMLKAKAEEITDTEFRKQIWQDQWKIHWPGGADDPEFTVIKLSPSFARGVHKEGSFEFKLK
ncbi:MAG: pyridoxamine 5'-phosphate oxidase family protein [Sedimentisphaerales bacterium]|nr:pyridoxamine 5'-phosphate oxidase family protein [Sedimentisphaerales bacterium]